MEKIIAAAIRHRKVTLFFVLAAALLGLYTYAMLPKQENPDMTAPVAMLTVTYPGASPEDVEESVTKKIEDQLVSIGGYDYSESYSRNSVSKVILWLENNTDVEKAWSSLRQKMDDLENELPEGCSPVDINTELADTAGMIISLSGNGYSYEQLAEFAGRIKDELIRIDGVSRFEISGKQEKEVRVEVDSARLNQTRLSLSDVVSLIAARNTEIPAGEIKSGGISMNVSASGKYSSIVEIGNTILDVSAENRSVLRLKDIARVFMEDEDSNYMVKHNGNNAVLLTGYFQDNKNIIPVGREVEKRLSEIKKLLPPDLVIDDVLFQPADVNTSVADFMKNLLIGVIIVAAVVYGGMGRRNAAVIATAIPLSILCSFGAMGIFGIKVHQISIAGLIIALGMLVDNAIVISDAIQVRLDKLEDRLSACVNGTKEVAIPVLTSTVTTIAAFLPLLILQGVAGDFVRAIPQLVIISLSASYLVAILVTPVMAFIFFRPGQGMESRIFLRGHFLYLFEQAIRKKKTLFGLIAGILVLTVGVASLLPLVFFPKADKNIMYIDLTAEQAENLTTTDKLVGQIEALLQEQEETIKYTSAIGSGLPKFFMTVPHAAQSRDCGQVLFEFDLQKGRRFENSMQFADYLQENLDSRLTDGTATVKQLELAEPVEAPVQIMVTGTEHERIVAAAGEIKNILSSIKGTQNVRDDAYDEVYEYLVKLDAEQAALLGIGSYDAQKEMNIALQGKTASLFRQGGEEYNILVKSNIASKEQLENLAVKSPLSGNKVLLKQVAETKLASRLPIIKRYDRERTVKVLSDVKFGYSAVTVQNSLQKQLEKMSLEGVRVVYNGEREKIRYHFGNVGSAALFAAIFIYIILLIQFGSLVQPLVILITIPLSMIGSVAGLFLFRQPLSFTALLGIVSLMGVVVNNAIIMLDYINYRRKEGINCAQACRDALERRFRPIIMTTGTTILGLIPLAFSGTLFVPMAVSLMSGLLVSTLLTLVVIPAVYMAVAGRDIYGRSGNIYTQ